MSKLVSIIIPVYKNVNYLKDSLRSAINQTYKKVEIIVISDGSPDFNKIKKIIHSFKTNIRLIKIKKNYGVSFALNLGIIKSKGKYFSWLSHDDYFHKDKLKKQVDLIEREKKMICFTNTFLVDGKKRKIRKINVNSIFFDIKTNLFFRDNLNLSTALINKNIFRKVGKFNVKLRHTQDYDFMFRVFKIFEPILLKKNYFFSRTHNKQSSKLFHSISIQEKEKLYINKSKKINLIFQKSNLIQKSYILFFLYKKKLKSVDLIINNLNRKNNYLISIIIKIFKYLT